MIGAIIGDIAGSRFEFNNYRKKDFQFFSVGCKFTDDTVMTLAVGKAVKEIKERNPAQPAVTAAKIIREVGRLYPMCGYGSGFYRWVFSAEPKPYNSYGNGAAMRVSAAGYAAKSLEEAKRLSKIVTEVSHNHPEGIKGAEAVAVAIYLAKTGYSKQEIGEYIRKNYYEIDFTLDDIRPTYSFNETCQNSVPQAIEAFLESNDYEDAIRNAISIGGDSDTLGAIAGGIAEAYYGVPQALEKQGLEFLDDELRSIYCECRNYNRII